MIFADPLLRGTLLRRYKRFLADVSLESGAVVTAHCPNSGSMLSVDTPGAEVWLSPARNPERRLKYTWELIRIGETLVGINTGHPNALVAEAVAADAIPELGGYTSVRREVKYGRNSRIDLLLEGDGVPKCFVEVKNVTLKRHPGPACPAEFPDAVTARGTKHLVELAERVRAGDRAVMMFLVQRDDADRFALAEDIDPAYVDAFARAKAAGVEALCYRCRVSPREIRMAERVPISLGGGAGRRLDFERLA